MNRCFWYNLKNPLYVTYHDEEWGRQRFDDPYLFEMLLLESFQAVGVINAHNEGCDLYRRSFV